MRDKYVAFYSEDYEYETFKTFEEAEKWLKEYDNEDGIAEESIEGRNFIAKITHRSVYRVTDKREDYHLHTEDCPDDCGEEEWPYDYDYDTVGVIEYKPPEGQNV